MRITFSPDSISRQRGENRLSREGKEPATKRARRVTGPGTEKGEMRGNGAKTFGRGLKPRRKKTTSKGNLGWSSRKPTLEKVGKTLTGGVEGEEWKGAQREGG